MAAIKLEQFGGMLPAWDGHLLPVGQATYAKNAYLFSGALSGWRVPKELRTLTDASARMVYRIPAVVHVQAVAYLAFLANPTAGDTVTIGEQTYTFQAAVVDPFDVLIGADSATTSQYLSEAVTADGGENTNSGVHYGANTPLNGDVKYYAAEDTVVPGLTGPQVDVSNLGGTDYYVLLVGAEDFGAAYNLIKVAESTANARLTWLYDQDDIGHTTTTFRSGTNPTFDPSITGSSLWLEFDDPDTNVFKPLVSDDQWQRYYFASPSQMPAYNTYDRIANADPSWLLGVPAPGCAVTLETSGGGNTLLLGNVSAGAPIINGVANTIYVTQITPTGATQLTNVSFGAAGDMMPEAGLPDVRFAGVLYGDNAGVPGVLLAAGAITVGVTGDSDNISTFVHPPALEEGTPYWVGIFIDTVIPFMSGPAGATTTNNTTSWPDTFTNGPSPVAPGSAVPAQAGMNIWAVCNTTDVLESRAYCYTWVSEYGEEGPPSPPTLLTGWSNGTWTLGLWQPPPDDLGVLRNLKKLNIYRTVTSAGGGAVFFYVTTLDIGVDLFIDTIPDDTVALNDILASTNWYPPPAGLLGFTVLQNGMVAGFTKNEIWFCEPYHPHAWPPGYVLTVDYPIVGLGVTNGALVVCTGSLPYVISGNAPAAMTQFKCQEANPCSSRASILGGAGAVSYMSPNGLVQVTSVGIVTNTTDLWFTREKWQQLTSQHDGRAILLASCYYCLGAVSVDGTDTSEAQRGFTIALEQDNASFTIWPQPGGHRMGFGVLDSPTGEDVQNVLTDPWTGTGLVVSNGKVWYFDFTDAAPERLVYTWKSKLYQQNTKRGYGAMKVYFTVPVTTPAQNATRIEAVASDAVWASLPDDSYGFLKTYVDVDGTGTLTLIDCREIRKPGEILRIVDGFKADHWQWEVVSRVDIANIQIATSPKELAHV